MEQKYKSTAEQRNSSIVVQWYSGTVVQCWDWRGLPLANFILKENMMNAYHHYIIVSVLIVESIPSGRIDCFRCCVAVRAGTCQMPNAPDRASVHYFHCIQCRSKVCEAKILKQMVRQNRFLSFHLFLQQKNTIAHLNSAFLSPLHGSCFLFT